VTTSYTAQHFFDGENLHPSSRITVEDGVVSAIESCDGPVDHYLVSPGLIDLQMNGYQSVDVATADPTSFETLDSLLLSSGTTSWLGTIVTAPLDRLSSTIANLNDIVSSTDTGCVGLHLEGPFLGHAPGAHRPDWIIPFHAEWAESLPSVVKLITVAPEQEGVLDNIANMVMRGVVVSLGHTRSNFEQWDLAVSAGARMVTHLFNGMSGVHHRDDGVALAALTDSRVVCGLIADLVHVSPRAVKLAFSSKGGEGVCLVSDSVAWESVWAQRRGVEVIDGAPRLTDGTLAGSSTPLAVCVRSAIKHCGISLVDALTAATATPATMLGYPQMGRIAVGQRADLVMFNEELTVVEARRGLVSIRG